MTEWFAFACFVWFVAILLRPDSARLKAAFPLIVLVVVAWAFVGWLTHPMAFTEPSAPGYIECPVHFSC